MIKKQLIVLSLSLFIGMTTFAQKSELKAADKALKKKNYAGALSAISQAERLIANADAKSKAKFYYIKGMALYGNGSNYDVDTVAEALNKVLAIEKDKGTKYSTEAGQTIDIIIREINDQAAKDFKTAKATNDFVGFKKAADGYYKVYQLSPVNTPMLYNSAQLNHDGKDYQKSLDQFQQLLDMNYDGIMTIFKATNIKSGKVETYNSKNEMDLSVRMKITKDPTVENTKSKVNEIIKYMAFDYIGLGKNDKALELFSKARAAAPNDYNLIISEANIYYQMGDDVKYALTIEDAIKLKPNDAQLHYNVGTLSMDIDTEKAKKHLLKAIELNPDYAEAYYNYGNLILKKLDIVQKEMDANAMNFAKYDQIKLSKWVPILKESLPYIEKAYELNSAEEIKKKLNVLYENLDMEKTIE